MHLYTSFDRKFLWVNWLLVGLLVVITIVPLVYVVVASFMDPSTLINQGISFNPRDWTVEGYKRVFADDSIVRGFLNSLFYSFAFSVLTVFISMITAYPLAKPDLYGRGAIMIFLSLQCLLGAG